MNKSNITIIGDYINANQRGFDSSLILYFKASHIEKSKLWKSKDLSAEFLGNFWLNIIDIDTLKSTLHFICAELLENAVCHSIKSEYMIMIKLCFNIDELLIYVKNNAETKKIEEFKKFINAILSSKDLQKLFVKKIKDAKKFNTKKSQVGLITIIKDRGANLSWKFKQDNDITIVTTLARISLNKKD